MSQTTTPNPTNKLNFESEIPQLMPYLAYTNLIIGVLCTTYRAYTNNDRHLLTFIALMILGYLLLELCFRALYRLSRCGTSCSDVAEAKRLVLKIAIWLISSAILFGFTYKITAYSGQLVSFFIFVAVAASSACIFFVYFVLDEKVSVVEPVLDIV